MPSLKRLKSCHDSTRHGRIARRRHKNSHQYTSSLLLARLISFEAATKELVSHCGCTSISGEPWEFTRWKMYTSSTCPPRLQLVPLGEYAAGTDIACKTKATPSSAPESPRHLHSDVSSPAGFSRSCGLAVADTTVLGRVTVGANAVAARVSILGKSIFA
jgi:hypothetical protein